MIALLVGFLLVAFAVFSVLPAEWSLNWWYEAIEFLKGGLPLLAVFVGLISFFVGVADIKDKMAAKREEQEEQQEAKKQAQESGDAAGGEKKSE